MKKLLAICAAATMVAACTGITPAKVENENYECLICEACDSLDYYASLDSTSRNYLGDYTYYKSLDGWYDSLTVLVYNYLYDNNECMNYSAIKCLLNNEKFMKTMDDGFDGLCNIEDSTGCIMRFYNAYIYLHK